MGALSSTGGAMTQLSSLRQLAQRLNISLSTARRLVDRGELPVIRLGRRLLRVDEEDIQALMRRWTSTKVSSPNR